MSGEKINASFDALVIGAGVAGQEAALNLAKMNFKVLLVEKDMSIGGKMVQLSKVFPTLDCAACITTPKMSETARHPNITIMTSSEVLEIEKNENGFDAKILKNPRYIKEDACTGCQKCEFACPVILPDQYNYGLAGRKVAYIPFNLASPRIALIDRKDISAPCIHKCPGGVKPYGFVSLVRAGLYEEAMKLHLEDAPIPGSLGRACFAPCEDECTRKELEGPVSIRKIKRFFTDYYYNKFPNPPDAIKIENKTGRKIAIIGSGPAGLTAAYFLALKGHTAVIYEAEKEAGGMLRNGIPAFRLPKKIVERDIKNITSLGVEIITNTRITSVKKLKDDGFDSVFIAVGASQPISLGIEGEDNKDVRSGLELLKKNNFDEKVELNKKIVLIVGGGNVAIDVARTALRIGAKEVHIMALEKRDEMFATEEEINLAIEEGVIIHNSIGPFKVIVNNGKAEGVETIRCIQVFDENGKFAPKYDQNEKNILKADNIYISIGQKPGTENFKTDGIQINNNGTIKVNAETLQSAESYVFAGGDTVTGPAMIIDAVGQGKKAAFYIDKYLNNENLDGYEFGEKLPAVNKEEVLKRKEYETKNPVEKKERTVQERIKDFDEVEYTITEEEALYSASRCLDCSNCRECHQCIEACPADAIDFTQKKEEFSAKVKSVILAQGFELFPPEHKEEYGYNKYKNVIHSMEMDRFLAPTRPFHDILSPLDGRKPCNIAYVLCTGSRDKALNNPICSQICCMYSIKQAQLLMGALPMADVTIYYIDIRAFGKGYDEFYEQAKSMGVNFVKGKVAKITEKEDESGNLILRYEDIEGGTVNEAEHDFVVLSVGILPNTEMTSLFKKEKLELDDYNYVKQTDELLCPAKTSIEGVFVAGTASYPMDIPDSILAAGAASAESASYIKRQF